MNEVGKKDIYISNNKTITNFNFVFGNDESNENIIDFS